MFCDIIVVQSLPVMVIRGHRYSDHFSQRYRHRHPVCHENHVHILLAVLPVLVIIVVVAVVSVISLPFSCFESEQKCDCC